MSTLTLTHGEIEEALHEAPEGIRDYVRHLEAQIRNLSEIGLALSREKDMDRVLEMILLEAKRIADADGGTLYMMTEDQRLRFEIMVTDSLNLRMKRTEGQEIPFPAVPLYDEDGAPNTAMVAAHAALTGETVNIEDAYVQEGFDFSGTKAYDRQTGYRSRSFLTVPLKNHLDEIIGVLQLLNAIDPKTREPISFSLKAQDLVEGLASQAAVVITKKNLIRDLENLFESFIRLIAIAIDAKSPYTGGHCARVPVITMMLAEAVDRTQEGPFKEVRFSEEEMRELKIAAWLHDCGKVTTPEYVVDKATKLEALFDRIHLVKARFEVLKRDEEIAYLEKRAEVEQDGRLDAGEKDTVQALERTFTDNLNRLEKELAFIREVNRGNGSMDRDSKDRLTEIARRCWKEEGEEKPLLSEEELKHLFVERGTLTQEERQVINDHIVQTIHMLTQLPYPKHLRNVPEFAGGHHEKMDGTGYPKGLRGDQMSIQARIMVIADVFEALTARDRPYKKGLSLNQTLEILERMKTDGHLDPDLFEVFVREQVPEHYAGMYMGQKRDR